MSLVLRGSPPPRLLPLIAAVAVCDVVSETQTVGEAQIKWPNDVVLARGRRLAKLAGILTEGRLQEGWAVLGVGLNVAVRLEDLPAELSSPESDRQAATLGLSAEQIEPTLARLLAALERRLGEPVQTTLAAWRARDALRGRTIAWGVRGPEGWARHGRAEGIDGDGRLVVAFEDGGHTTLDAGEVHLEEVE
jgi:BirA family biotin operon repressor/biotin-[acetyl-CoA-carboxylase] ligase